MGDIFFHNYYSIFDYPNYRIGLVEAKGEPTTDGWESK